jgi:nucleoside triphosphate pyrophosphatase
MDLILASSSPRRRELLAQLGVDFQVVPSEVDEALALAEAPGLAALRLARAKAGAVAARLDRGLVLGADTLVAVQGQILGKPSGPAEMREHLRLLAGRTHQVVTGLVLIDAATSRSCEATEVTEVDFDPLGDAEIDWYVRSGEGLDKAGSYGYQGLASVLISGIRGCYFNVVGLPLSRLRRLMAELGVDLLAQPRAGRGSR